MRIVHANEIRRPPDKVFPWIENPQKAMQWQKNVKGGEILVETPEKIGTTFREVIEEDSGRLEMRGTITEFAPNQCVVFHLESSIHEFDVRYLVEPRDGNTRLTITADIRWKFPMNVLSLFIGSRMKAGILRQLESEVLDLKRFCESE